MLFDGSFNVGMQDVFVELVPGKGKLLLSSVELVEVIVPNLKRGC